MLAAVAKAQNREKVTNPDSICKVKFRLLHANENSTWVALFSVFEETVGGLLHGKGLAGGFSEILGRGTYELLARCMMVFIAFIPFFAFRETERVLGQSKVRELFFRKRAAVESDLSGGSTPHASARSNP
jgi:hypothetical protein